MFDKDNDISHDSGGQKSACISKDLNILMTELQQSKVFQSNGTRMHVSFQNPSDPLHSKSKHELTHWLVSYL